MIISFLYEDNQVAIANEIKNRLILRGHEIKDYHSTQKIDVLVVIGNAMSGTQCKAEKTVCIGSDEGGDITINPFYERKSDFSGSKYIVVPGFKNRAWDRYRANIKSKTIFVGINNHSTILLALEVLSGLGVNAIVATDDHELKKTFSRIEIFDEEDCYNAMYECVAAITDGGTIFLQSLSYGMPTVAISDDKIQENIVGSLKHCCLPVKKEKEDIETKISWLIESEYHRKSLSMLATHFVDGKGTDRICSIIDGLRK